MTSAGGSGEVIDVLEITRIARSAGDGIVNIYEKDFSVEYKSDHSPLTEADRHSNRIITAGLEKLYPAIPILSEESSEAPYGERNGWRRFWLVDPLDGTKEFVKRNGEFTVNIALVRDGKPVLGVIYAPVIDTLYFGSNDIGSFKLKGTGRLLHGYEDTEELIGDAQRLTANNSNRPYTIVGSRSHMSPETQEFIAARKVEHGIVDILSIGSSLKLCMVAEGMADVYPRFGPTMEWDTAAGHAIITCADGNVVDTETGNPLEYNKADLLNPWFIASCA